PAEVTRAPTLPCIWSAVTTLTRNRAVGCIGSTAGLQYVGSGIHREANGLPVTNESRAGVLHQLDRLHRRGSLAGYSEAQLLRRFYDEGDTDALEAILARHGSLVLRVCRQVLATEHLDLVEDAFQATCLVLIRRARAIRRPECLSNWLYGVAV